MTEQEIRDKLKRLKEGRLQGDDWMTAYQWLLNELERQLERNERLDKQLAEAGTRAVEQHDTIMNYRDEVEFLKKQLAEVKGEQATPKKP